MMKSARELIKMEQIKEWASKNKKYFRDYQKEYRQKNLEKIRLAERERKRNK